MSTETAHRYDFRTIEARWQEFWERNGTYRTLGPGDPGFDGSKPKSYILDMFPYPSGKGLHVGHPLGYIATDIVSRYKRMRGHNVLHPMGYDAFGLPAEQYAIETGTHPRVTTEANIKNIRRQLRALALSYDWDRELKTIDPEYYRWTQWIFLQLFESWFDPAAKKARPIRQLVERFERDEWRGDERGQLLARPGPNAPGDQAARWASMPKWRDLDAAGRSRVLLQHRLAYVAEVPVNWCPMLGTVLANEEVTNDGRSERGNYPVFRRPLEQWMLRITRYADRLIDDLDGIDWSESLKQLQRNWIGRSEGARVRFALADPPAVRGDAAGSGPLEFEIFTTRPDTLFGATYMVLAPEHPLVLSITTPAQRSAVESYRTQAASRTELDRQADQKTKDGVFTGAFAINPVNGERIPIWIADYVLMGYGTGAIMAVPGSDQRDFEFACQHGLPVRPVVQPSAEWLAEHAPANRSNDARGSRAEERSSYLADPKPFGAAFCEEGVAVNSANAEVSLDGLPTAEAKGLITGWLEQKGLGRGETQYKLRDWLFSRQRYWGEPFPILHGEDGEILAVDDSELPVPLPEMEEFRPRGSDDPSAPPQPTLARAPETWRTVVLNGKQYRRELNTMPQWAGSCWYYLRYIDPHNHERMVDPQREHYWMSPNGVDLYVGGVEHAVLHLLYARFWHKVLFDLGHVTTSEPFGRLYNQGYIQAYAYQDARGIYVDAEEVVERDGRFFFGDEEVTRLLGKMGKSLKNSVPPDDVVHEYGCDTLRLYEMYLGPIDASKLWSTHAIVGVHRFLQRLWRNLVDEETGALRVEDVPADEELRRLLHRTIQQVTDDMDAMRCNTAIARLIELNNALVSRASVPREVAEPLVLMLAPQAPHMAEELWHRLGDRFGFRGVHLRPGQSQDQASVAYADWPRYDERYLVQDQIEIVVQVLGKRRGAVMVPASASEKDVEAAALADPGIAKHIEGKTVRKAIHVPGKLLNLVVG